MYEHYGHEYLFCVFFGFLLLYYEELFLAMVLTLIYFGKRWGVCGGEELQCV